MRYSNGFTFDYLHTLQQEMIEDGSYIVHVAFVDDVVTIETMRDGETRTRRVRADISDVLTIIDDVTID